MNNSIIKWLAKNNDLMIYKCMTCKGEFLVDTDNMPYSQEVFFSKKGQKISYKDFYCFCPYCKSKHVVNRIFPNDR